MKTASMSCQFGHVLSFLHMTNTNTKSNASNNNHKDSNKCLSLTAWCGKTDLRKKSHHLVVLPVVLTSTPVQRRPWNGLTCCGLVICEIEGLYICIVNYFTLFCATSWLAAEFLVLAVKKVSGFLPDAFCVFAWTPHPWPRGDAEISQNQSFHAEASFSGQTVFHLLPFWHFYIFALIHQSFIKPFCFHLPNLILVKSELMNVWRRKVYDLIKSQKSKKINWESSSHENSLTPVWLRPADSDYTLHCGPCTYVYIYVYVYVATMCHVWPHIVGHTSL